MHKTPVSQIDSKLALYCNLTTEWGVTPIEEAKILFKEMLSLIYLSPGNNTGIEVKHSSETGKAKVIIQD